MAIQRVVEFIATLESNKVTSVAELCKRELDYLRLEYRVKDIANQDGICNGLATYKKAITNYRKAIYNLNPNHPAMEFLKMDELDVMNFNKQNQRSSMRAFDTDEYVIKDADTFISLSISLLTANSYIDRILGIAALTGRRVNEIAVTSSFELCDEKEFNDAYERFGLIYDNNGFFISELSKKKTYEHSESLHDSGIIPVLENASIVLSTIENLRIEKQFKDNEHFHNVASKALSEKVKKYYAPILGEKCKVHDLRKAYARILFDETGLPERALLTFYESVLLQSCPSNYAKFSSSIA